MNMTALLKRVLPAIVLAGAVLPQITTGAETIIAQTSTITACGKLFEIDSNAANLSAAERARIVQKNLDNALVAAKNRTPAAVRVEIANRNPIVTLDGYHIVTADGNSAARNRMTQMQLAEKWADSIRLCMADTVAMTKYVQMITGNYVEKTAVKAVAGRDDIAVAPREMLFPVELATPLSCDATEVGDTVEAVVSHDVPLGPSFATYIPAGTVAIGQIVSARPYTNNNYAGKDGFSLQFNEFRMPDGKKIPIDAHILGGLNTWRQISIQPVSAECCNNTKSIKEASIVSVHVQPSKGVVAGGWKSSNYEVTSQAQLPRLVFKRHPGLVVGAGEPMMLQLSATTTIAVASQTM